MAKKKTPARKKAPPRRKTAPRRKAPARKRSARKRPRPPRPSPTLIQVWPTDPMGSLPPVQQPAPSLPGSPLATRILAPAPSAGLFAVGTAEFRFWTAAETLRRGVTFWAAAGAKAWHRDVGASLPVRLDDGVDLNAYYARSAFPSEGIEQGLSFFHDTIRESASRRRLTVFSGESPDVVAHELGHAVLDTLKPAIWGVAATEPAAFHESFGDMSAILTGLQLAVVRQAVLEETDGNLRRSSSISRVAEQLGFAIRQRSPAAVDADSLRNAANAFAYVDPLTLPASGPAATLTRAPHNFSRVFTGAFLDALAGMVLLRAARPREQDLQAASLDIGRLLARAVAAAPVRTTFFAAVAEQMVLADAALFSGRYARALTTAFVRRGLIPVRSLAAPDAVDAATPARAAAAAASAGRPVRIAIDGTPLGLPFATLFVQAPPVEDSAPPSLGARAVAPAREGATRYTAVQAFVEGLIARGRLGVAPSRARAPILMAPLPQQGRATHYLDRQKDGFELRRLTFECC